MISIYLRPGCRSHPQGALQTVIFTFTYNHNFRTQNEDVSIRGGEALANRRQVIQVVFWRWNERASISFILSAALDRLAELRFGKFARQPIQSLVEAVTLGRACRLDVPLKHICQGYRTKHANFIQEHFYLINAATPVGVTPYSGDQFQGIKRRTKEIF